MVRRPGSDPRARQRAIAAERDARVEETARSLGPLRRRLFRLLLGWAQRFGPDREQALFYMGAGWPTLRRLALELGRRLTDAGSLLAPEDVFFLQTPEIESASRAAGGRRGDARARAPGPRAARVARGPQAACTRRRWCRGTTSCASVRSTCRSGRRSGATSPTGAVLRGFAVSPGQVTAPASVVRSPADFSRMEPGTILVCPTTTPAWTPLFSQARGLVTDVGGVLAHGSIVAREYGIPAVLGTGIATTRIRSGQTIRVDGDAGTVTLLDGTDEAEAERASPQPEARSLPSAKTVALAALVAGAMVVAAWWRNRRRN